MDFINKYLPVNTPEKINLLIEEILSMKQIAVPPEEFINFICLYINKRKLQIFFRETIQAYTSELKNKYSAKYRPATGKTKNNNENQIVKKKEIVKTSVPVTKKIRKKPYKELKGIGFISPGSMIGKNLDECAAILQLTKKELKDLLSKYGIDATKKFSVNDFKKVKAELNTMKKRIIEIKLPNENNHISYLKYNQRFSPTLGKEGNYFKLIYIRSKT